MQREDGRKRARLIVVCAVAAAALLVIALLIFGGGARKMGYVKLPCTSSQAVTPFGDRVLYYDGTTLFCLSSGGSEMWSIALGAGAGFHVSDGVLVAWVNNQIKIIDKNGRVSYDDRLADTVQFARASRKYIAAILGESVSPSLICKDMDGITIDSETLAYEDMMILDMGFFENGEYLWTTALDVYGTVPDVVLNTYRVGQMNTGETSLGQALTYAIVYAGDKLHVINTRQLRLYDYRGVQSSDDTVLVYGWQLIDSYAPTTGGAMLLLAPVLQTTRAGDLAQLRLIHGAVDNRYTLPAACVGACLRNRTLYAFSADNLYRAAIGSQRFSALSLPMQAQATDFLGMLDSGVALLACDREVYAVTVP